MELDAALAIQLSNVVTKDDLLAFGKSLADQVAEKYHEQIFAAFSGITNASGNVGFRVYDVPDGMQFYPSRYIVWSDAHTPGTSACFQSTTCYGGIYHGIGSPVNLADYFPPPSGGLGEATTPNILPYYKEFNKHDSPEFEAPDNVFFNLVSGPATTNITCILYGWLEEIREGNAIAKKRKRFRSHPSFTRRQNVADRDVTATLG